MARLVLFAALAFAVAGCGGKFSEVKGTVKLDGTPVEGASVTLLTEDAKASYSGVTDASGNFEILSSGKPGAPAGSYKVTVMKLKKVVGKEGETPGGEGYMKMMAASAKETAKKSSSIGPPTGPIGPGVGGPKGELPAIYSAASTTPLTATIPLNGPLELNLKSKP